MNYKRFFIVVIFIAILQIVMFKCLNVPLADKYILLKLAVIGCVSISLAFSLIYIISNSLNKNYEIEYGLSWDIFFIILIIVSYLPVTMSKYLWHDDFLNYNGKFIDSFSFSVTQGRIATGLYMDAMFRSTVENSFYGRSIAVVGILLIFLMFLSWMRSIGYGYKLSLVLPFLCSVSLPFLNISAYLTEYTFVWGALFSIISVVAFVKSMDCFAAGYRTDFIILSLVALSSVLLSLFTYQATSTVSFGLIVSYLLSRRFSRSKVVKTVTYYYLFFAVAAILYLLFNKIIWIMYKIPPNTRTALISSVPDIINKAYWFITVIIPQSFNQLLFTFIGKALFLNEFSLVRLDFKYGLLGYVIQSLAVVIVICGAILVLRNTGDEGRSRLTSLVLVALLLIAIPYSYFYLLVARESSFLTFYASGIVTVMFVVICILGNEVLHAVIKNTRHKNMIFLLLVIPVLVLISFNNNRYLYAMWVRDNDFNYHYVKMLLKNNDRSSKKIHVIGATGEVDVYWISATKLALTELGESSGNFKIYYSDDEYVLNSIAQQRYNFLEKTLTAEEIDLLNRYYIHDKSFGFYYLKTNDIPLNVRINLKQLFEKADLIPSDKDKALMIDMRKIR